MDAKLQLSTEELRLISDPEWILTKNSVMGKIVELFAGLSGDWRGRWADVLPPTDPKISRGENYKGLPWVMLDYPRVFGKKDTFAIRTMFWWGHAFSVTLHLKGEYRRLFIPVIRRHWRQLEAAGFRIGVAEDEWEHAHTAEHYPAGGEFPERDFLKLSAHCGLGQWKEAPVILTEYFDALVRVLRETPGDR